MAGSFLIRFYQSINSFKNAQNGMRFSFSLAEGVC